ncbi:MAG: hydantoinase/oxoprolinase N-terminal domain-containing protein, partial [Eubacterium callanderi]
MQTVLGIDTGGTNTDADLQEQKTKKVLKKAKSPTTRENLALG